MATTESSEPSVAAGGGGAWITTIAPDEATGELAKAYNVQQQKLGHVTELTQVGSLYPDLVATRLRLYEVVEATPSAVPSWARRAVALLTSVLNDCRFCTVGHTERLMAEGYGNLAEDIKADPAAASSDSPEVNALLDYTRALVRTPGAITKEHVEALTVAGWDDLDILDVNNIAAYYCYINRVANGLGLTREA